MKTCPACNHQNPADALVCESCGDRLEISSGWDKTTIRGSNLEVYAPGSLVADRYEIIREIGRGGMGVVYRVRDTRLQSREMALKMIHPQLVELPEARQRFEQEVNTCLDLLHPNIVRVHNLEEWQGQQFFTMEYITGRSLHELIAERKSQIPPFSLSEAAAIISPLLDALIYAHQYTIHRDIKPDNIIVIGDFPDVTVKVLDFGIAKTLSASDLTQTAQALGTAFYMAPEQMSGGEIDHRADLYSTGMVLYEMLTGEMAVGRFRLPGEIYSGMPKAIDEMLEKSLASKPEQRFPDATAMQQALQKALSIPAAKIKVKPVSETPTQRKPQQIQKDLSDTTPVNVGIRRKFPPWVYASVAILVVFLAAGAFFLSRGKKVSVATAPTTPKEQIQPKAEVEKATVLGKKAQPEAVSPKPMTKETQPPQNLPKGASENYIFSRNEKILNRMKILALTAWQGDREALIQDFQKKGIKLAILPRSEAPRALEVGVVDGVLTASQDLIDELKKKFPAGVVAPMSEIDSAASKKLHVTNKIKITMRESPDRSSKIIGILESDDEVDLIEQRKDWTKVKTKTGRVGWVMTRFLQGP